MIIKRYFNKLSDSTKCKVIILVILFFLSLAEWAMHPPFFKDQNIKIVNIEPLIKNTVSGKKRCCGKRFYYIYNTADSETVEGSFDLYTYPMPELNDRIVQNVRTPYSDGGELRILSGAFIIFLGVSAVFIIAFIFRQFLRVIGLRRLSESSSNAILFAIFVTGLFIFNYI